MSTRRVYARLKIETDAGIKITHLHYSLKLTHPKTKDIQIISPNRLQSFSTTLQSKEHSWDIERPNHKEKYLGYFNKTFTDAEFEDYLKQFKAVFTLYLNDQPLGVDFYFPVSLKSGQTNICRWKMSTAQSQQIKTVEEQKFGCLHTNAGAHAIARMIADDMNKNIRHPVTKKLQKLNAKALEQLSPAELLLAASSPSSYLVQKKLPAYTLFRAQIDYDMPWDHKHIIKANPEFRALSLDGNQRKEGHYHRYKDFDYFYDVWSNIHYGFIGRVCGFTEWELNYGAGAAQLREDFKAKAVSWWELMLRFKSGNAKRWDNPEDQVTIELGYVMYNEYMKGIKPRKERILQLLDLTDKAKLKGAKTLHKENCHKGNWIKPKQKNEQ